MFTKAFLLDLGERSVWTFIQAFLAVGIVTGFDNWDGLKAGLIAGLIAVAKCVLAANVGNSNTAQALPGVESAYVSPSK